MYCKGAWGRFIPFERARGQNFRIQQNEDKTWEGIGEKKIKKKCETLGGQQK